MSLISFFFCVFSAVSLSLAPYQSEVVSGNSLSSCSDRAVMRLLISAHQLRKTQESNKLLWEDNCAEGIKRFFLLKRDHLELYGSPKWGPITWYKSLYLLFYFMWGKIALWVCRVSNCCPLIRWSVVWSLALPVGMSVCPWTRYWTSKVCVCERECVNVNRFEGLVVWKSAIWTHYHSLSTPGRVTLCAGSQSVVNLVS